MGWLRRGFGLSACFLQILNNDVKPRSPFKFNANWLLNEEFVSLLKELWTVYVDNPVVSPVAHFATNLKHIKDVSILWYVNKKAQERKDLVDIELLLVESFNTLGFVFSYVEDKSYMVELEVHKRKILLDHEHEARQKSKAIWILCGDDNTPFFHNFSNHRKNINSIWKIADDGGNLVQGFDSIDGEGVHHFESLFQEEKNLYLPELLKIAGNFPTSITEEENEDILTLVTLKEIQYVLSLSKNDKSPGPDGIPVEAYRDLFDVLGLELLRVVEDSRKSGKIPTVLIPLLLH